MNIKVNSSINWDIRNVNIEDIKESTENVRITFESLESLAESIKENGLLYPPIIHRIDKNTYEVIDGHRRIRAVKTIGWQTVRCAVFDYELSKEEIQSIMIATDEEDRPWNKYDYAKRCFGLYDNTGSIETAAQKMGLHKNEIGKFIAVGSLDRDVLGMALKKNVPYNFVELLANKVATKQMTKKMNMTRNEMARLFIEKYLRGEAGPVSEFNKCVPKIKEADTEAINYWLKSNQGIDVLKALLLGSENNMKEFKKRFKRGLEKLKNEVIKLEEAENISLKDAEEIKAEAISLSDTTRRIHKKLHQRHKSS